MQHRRGLCTGTERILSASCLQRQCTGRDFLPSAVGWVISSEIQPLETRCLGQGVTVFMSMINSAIIGQCFLTMLCTLEWGVYVLFTVCQLGGLLFCIFLLPETKGMNFLSPSRYPLPISHKTSPTSEFKSDLLSF